MRNSTTPSPALQKEVESAKISAPVAAPACEGKNDVIFFMLEEISKCDVISELICTTGCGNKIYMNTLVFALLCLSLGFLHR